MGNEFEKIDDQVMNILMRHLSEKITMQEVRNLSYDLSKLIIQRDEAREEWLIEEIENIRKEVGITKQTHMCIWNVPKNSEETIRLMNGAIANVLNDIDKKIDQAFEKEEVKP